MSKPTIYMTQEMYDEKFLRPRVLPAPVLVEQPKTARRVNLILLAAMCAGLAAILIVIAMQG